MLSTLLWLLSCLGVLSSQSLRVKIGDRRDWGLLQALEKRLALVRALSISARIALRAQSLYTPTLGPPAARKPYGWWDGLAWGSPRAVDSL